ncbi:hypothetical protein BN1051_01644 [Arthrobacter saudimassiliensis]|uniref:Uncharacterized protein n=1 Tax=Arthrobacter saudimassiliensis TaxID=1461584 RepID=A0A078MPU8_9MICC|nr:hypothetical protein BN1051_01644 [Arthrobacter saudimassiliensis]
MTKPMPAENTFDHLRDVDGEHVGYLHLDSDGKSAAIEVPLPTQRLLGPEHFQ